MGRAGARRKLAILDVGHGNCAVLQDSKGVAVIDTGRGNSLEIYLREEGIDRIDVVLISHADQDHLGGLISLLASRAVVIGRVRLNTDSVHGSKIWDDLLYELNHTELEGTTSINHGLTCIDSTTTDSY